MTEPTLRPVTPGRKARWGSAVALAPAAAAVLGGAIWWASDAVPTTAAHASTTVPSTAPDPHAATVRAEAAYRLALARNLAIYRQNSAALDHRLTGLRSDLTSVRRAVAAARSGGNASSVGATSGTTSGSASGAGSAGGSGSSSSGGGGYSSSGGSSGGYGSGGGSVVVAAPPVAPPPPPVHAVTRASGKP